MLVVVCSLKGSPGVTTFATALAARWPVGENPILVEADPAGGDLMVRFRLNDSPGLVTMAAAARRNTDPTLLAQHVQLLPSGLRIVIGPVGAEQARASLSALDLSSPLRRAADQPGTTVIADCGRVDPDSPALPIIRSADAMVLLARPHDDELSHVALRLTTAQRWSRRPGFVLVGDGYGTREVSQVLGIPVMGRVPQDDKGAAVLCGHGNVRSGPMRSTLGRAAAQIAQLIAARAQAADNGMLSGVPRQVLTANRSVPEAGLQPLGTSLRNGACS
ncbi:Mrp family chromosome partitioning ATPase [Saccharothrix ecbatanensis]|uniref:Mrp family chromosome partitioning ATPase n=1 Tax=Saccharothrix ecbatanensis TaxID=1105145 RepID=A0A7W9HFH0_9PSEU|nr:chromosome partitioning protein [Saccharothrix ecbatanensis]MBB5801292.1 Mrp family chromosome partitioning ATPase [Saccharothrix ecbatanensis]